MPSHFARSCIKVLLELAQAYAPHEGLILSRTHMAYDDGVESHKAEGPKLQVRIQQQMPDATRGF